MTISTINENISNADPSIWGVAVDLNQNSNRELIDHALRGLLFGAGRINLPEGQKPKKFDYLYVNKQVQDLIDELDKQSSSSRKSGVSKAGIQYATPVFYTKEDVQENFDQFRMQIAVTKDGKINVPGSDNYFKNIQQGNYGAVKLSNPFTKAGNVKVLSPTYWKIFYQYYIDGNEIKAERWLRYAVQIFPEMYELGYSQGNDGILLYKSQQFSLNKIKVPFLDSKTGGDKAFTPAEKKILSAAYKKTSDPLAAVRGKFLAIATLLKNAKMLHSPGKIDELPPSEWATQKGEDHARKVSEIIIDNVPAALLGLKPIKKFSTPLQYASYVTGLDKHGFPNSVTRSMHNPTDIVLDKDGNEVVINQSLYDGDKLFAPRNKRKTQTVSAAFNSGPGLTAGGKFYNMQSASYHYPAPNKRGKKDREGGFDYQTMGPYGMKVTASNATGRKMHANKPTLNTKGDYRGPGSYGNVTYHMRPGNQGSIYDSLQKVTSVASDGKSKPYPRINPVTGDMVAPQRVGLAANAPGIRPHQKIPQFILRQNPKITTEKDYYNARIEAAGEEGQKWRVAAAAQSAANKKGLIWNPLPWSNGGSLASVAVADRNNQGDKANVLNSLIGGGGASSASGSSVSPSKKITLSTGNATPINLGRGGLRSGKR